MIILRQLLFVYKLRILSFCIKMNPKRFRLFVLSYDSRARKTSSREQLHTEVARTGCSAPSNWTSDPSFRYYIQTDELNINFTLFTLIFF